MNSRFSLLLLAAAALTAATANRATAGIITQWNWGSSATSPFIGNTVGNTVAATSGTGVGSQVGMTTSYVAATNQYTYNNYLGQNITITATQPYSGNSPMPTSQAFQGDITNTAGSTVTDNMWRIRGPQGPPLTNGWSNAAPQYTQGTAWSVSTVGYTSIQFSYDWYTTAQGIHDLQAMVSTNGGSTFTPVGALNVAVQGDIKSGNVLDLSSVPGAANNPNLVVELVAAYDPSFGSGNEYTNGTAQYNNTSGNWRFGNLEFDGTVAAVPEPSSYVLVGLTAGLFFAGSHLMRRRRAQAASMSATLSA